MVQNRDSNVTSSTALRTLDIQPMISEKQENVCALHLDLRDLNCFPRRRSRVRSVSMVKESADFSFGTHTTYPRCMRARNLDRPMGMARQTMTMSDKNFIFLSPAGQWSKTGRFPCCDPFLKILKGQVAREGGKGGAEKGVSTRS